MSKPEESQRPSKQPYGDFVMESKSPLPTSSSHYRRVYHQRAFGGASSYRLFTAVKPPPVEPASAISVSPFSGLRVSDGGRPAAAPECDLSREEDEPSASSPVLGRCSSATGSKKAVRDEDSGCRGWRGGIGSVVAEDEMPLIAGGEAADALTELKKGAVRFGSGVLCAEDIGFTDARVCW